MTDPLLVKMREHFKGELADFEANTGKSIYEHAVPQFAPLLMRAKRRARGQDADTFSRSWPYCFQPLKTGGGRLWLPLNWLHEPLGMWKDDFNDYEAFAGRAWLFTRDPSELDGVWRSRHEYYLYEDTFSGRSLKGFERYAARLGRLLEATGDNGLHYFTSLTRTLPR